MNSIGIYSNDNSKLDIELHINIWHTVKKKNLFKKIKNLFSNIFCFVDEVNAYSNYLEFGFKLKNNIQELCIYLPLNITSDDIEDKIINLKNDIDLSEALFNRNIDVSTDDGKPTKIKFDGDTDGINYISLNKKNYSLEIEKAGVLIKVKMPTDLQGETLYYRFRINKLSNFIEEQLHNNSLFDGYEDNRAILSLNINQIRKIPSEIRDKIPKDKIFSKTIFFLLTDENTDIRFTSNSIDSTRILENNIWNKYVSLNNTEKVVAYQWGEYNGKHSKYMLLLKLGYRSKKFTTYILMIVVILFFGSLGGMLGNYFTSNTCYNFQGYPNIHFDTLDRRDINGTK